MTLFAILVADHFTRPMLRWPLLPSLSSLLVLLLSCCKRDSSAPLMFTLHMLVTYIPTCIPKTSIMSANFREDWGGIDGVRGAGLLRVNRAQLISLFLMALWNAWDLESEIFFSGWYKRIGEWMVHGDQLGVCSEQSQLVVECDYFMTRYPALAWPWLAGSAFLLSFTITLINNFWYMTRTFRFQWRWRSYASCFGRLTWRDLAGMLEQNVYHDMDLGDWEGEMCICLTFSFQLVPTAQGR